MNSKGILYWFFAGLMYVALSGAGMAQNSVSA